MVSRLLSWVVSWLERIDWCGGCGDPDCDDCAQEWSD